MSKLVEVKAEFAVTDAGVISGVAWPFWTVDTYGDEIAPGAFKLAVSGGCLPILYEHEDASLVGNWTEIVETDVALEVKGQLDLASPRALGLRGLIQTGRIKGLSIGYRANDFVLNRSAGRSRRLIKSLSLEEISIVAKPANPGARVLSAKSASGAILLNDAINRALAALRI